MNVSFGKIIYKNEIKVKTDKQVATEDVIDGIFSTRIVGFGVPEIILKRKLGADVLVINQKNGNTKIDIVNSDKKPIGIIPSLQLNNRRFLSRLFEQVEQYANDCRNILDNI
ncbi:hypothetical protein IJS77_01055 [bacterium]|nr:hypothetical protein [bacterium]